MLLGEQRQRAAVDRVLSEDLQRFIFHHLLIIHRQMTSLFLLLKHIRSVIHNNEKPKMNKQTGRDGILVKPTHLDRISYHIY